MFDNCGIQFLRSEMRINYLDALLDSLDNIRDFNDIGSRIYLMQSQTFCKYRRTHVQESGKMPSDLGT